MKSRAFPIVLALAACAATPQATDPQRQFHARLSALCGSAFAGRVTTSDAADRDLASAPLVMHVASCTPEAIRIAFHVGDDRSRTWVVSRTADGLRLKHDHRHRDGSEDARTQYGGDTAGPGSAGRQEFPADQVSRDLFIREGIPQSADNVWAIEIEPRRVFTYELKRPDRFLRVAFDLSRQVPPPPPAWGAR